MYLSKSVKYEEIYPKGYENLKDLKIGLKRYFKFYNEYRPHQGLGYKTPAEVYLKNKFNCRRAPSPHGGRKASSFGRQKAHRLISLSKRRKASLTTRSC